MAIVKMTTREPRGLQRGNRHTTRKHPGELGHPRKLWCHYFFAVDNMYVCVCRAEKQAPRSKQPPSTKSSRSESSWCRTGRRWWSSTTMTTTGMASKTMSLHARDTEGVWENDKLCLLFKPRELKNLGWPKAVPTLKLYVAVVAGAAAVISFIVLVTPTFYRVVVVSIAFFKGSGFPGIGVYEFCAPRSSSQSLEIFGGL